MMAERLLGWLVTGLRQTSSRFSSTRYAPPRAMPKVPPRRGDCVEAHIRAPHVQRGSPGWRRAGAGTGRAASHNGRARPPGWLMFSSSSFSSPRKTASFVEVEPVFMTSMLCNLSLSLSSAGPAGMGPTDRRPQRAGAASIAEFIVTYNKNRVDFHEKRRLCTIRNAKSSVLFFYAREIAAGLSSAWRATR